METYSEFSVVKTVSLRHCPSQNLEAKPIVGIFEQYRGLLMKAEINTKMLLALVYKFFSLFFVSVNVWIMNHLNVKERYTFGNYSKEILT